MSCKCRDITESIGMLTRPLHAQRKLSNATTLERDLVIGVPANIELLIFPAPI